MFVSFSSLTLYNCIFQKEAALNIVSLVPEEDVFHCRLHVMETETVKMGRMSLLYVVCMCNLYVVCAVFNAVKC